MIVFTMKQNWDKSCVLKLGGQELVPKDRFKYLVVILDSRVSWKEHLEVHKTMTNEDSYRQKVGIETRNR